MEVSEAMRNSIRLSLVPMFVVLFGTAAAWAQVQSPNQQKCINAMNKNGSKLNDAQCIDNRACIKDHGQERLGAMTAEACLTADRLGKIAKREGKTSAHETAFCTGTIPPTVPDFAKTDSNTVNAAAVASSIDMLHDIFGNPVDGGLAVCSLAPEECYCQRFMSKWIHKLHSTMPRIFRKCKKAALKVGKDPFFNGAMSAADIEDCWDDPSILISVAANPNNQIGKITANLSAEYQTLCVDQGVDTTVFPGCPGGGSASLDCVVDRVECRTCLMVNAMDNLAIDCDTFDNGAADSSCVP